MRRRAGGCRSPSRRPSKRPARCSGQDAEALAVSLLHADLLYVGLNCATGPALMADHLRTLSTLCRTRVACVPNAGLPDEDGLYREGPEVFREVFTRFLEQGWLNLVGGCCGSTDRHIATLAELVRGRHPRPVAHHQRSLVSGIEAVELDPTNRPLLVGERTNVLGSRRSGRGRRVGRFSKAPPRSAARSSRPAPRILDVCLQDPDRDELGDVEKLLEKVVRVVKAPLMIDSTDAAVMARALTWCQGKSILNSINLEDGLERFQKVVPLGRRFGAAHVVGLIDEKGMAVTVERKLEVARRSYRILTEEMEVVPEDIWWDPLVASRHRRRGVPGSAAATIEGARGEGGVPAHQDDSRGVERQLRSARVGARGPQLGLFYRATLAGLDAAIVNTERLARDAEIPDEERALADALLDPCRATRRRAKRRWRASPSSSASGAAAAASRRSTAAACRSRSARRAPSSRAARSGSRRISPRCSPIRATRIRWRSSTAR
ncbi:MAG: homocysteine S-methyltransferase family protein [Thermoanaerobaculia bacterium]